MSDDFVSPRGNHIRGTTHEAYEDILDVIMPKCRLTVLSIIKEYGPMTCNMVKEKLVTHYRLDPLKTNGAAPRIHELNAQGAVREVKRAACPISDYKCIWWQATDKPDLKKLVIKHKIKCEYCDGSGYIEKAEV